jgi:acetoin utilization deacetylase AcuC-like enzyme
MGLIVVASERFAEHQTPPGHPESPARAAVMDAVAGEWRQRGGEVVAPRAATDEHLRRVHADEYLAMVAAMAGRATAFDEDTYTSPETVEIARLAAGAAVDAVERVMGGNDRQALALVRPPGHHAERDRAMGFCFYNNVAVAAVHARTLGAARVAIVDYDVHHGNGTQHVFETDPHILYVSVHQSFYYPGTGAAREIGHGEGRGFTVNVPLEVGATDDDYRVVFEEVILPVTRQFAPDLILVSAGFDAHMRDPLAGMRLSTGSFGAMTGALRGLAEACCEGRIALVTEGGYDLRALRDSILDVVNVLGSGVSTPPAWPAGSPGSARGAEAVAATRAAVSAFWNL